MTMIRTMSGGSAEIDQARLDELRATFRGDVIAPGDPGYEEARAVHNAIYDRRPGLIIRCSGTADVVDAVLLAKELDLLVAVRSGSHSVAGHSATEGGLMIDLSGMNAVSIDPVTGVTIAQGGATWGDCDRETQLYGRAVPGGIISTTGVGGLTTGGGLGWLHRAYGLACDSLRSAEVVTADGTVVRAGTRDGEDPELLWALRGGGGNFGVVTSFEFDSHPVGPMVYNAAPVYRMADATEVFRGWAEWARGAPDEITSRALFWTFPDVEALPPEIRGQDVVILAALYAGPADEGERVLAPIRELGTLLADLSMAMPFRVAQNHFDPFFSKGGNRSYWKSLWLEDIGEQAVEMIVNWSMRRPHPATLVHLPLMGGATSEIPFEDSAFGDRSAAFMLSIDGNWTEAADDERGRAWVREFFDAAMTLPGARGTYLNFNSDAVADDATQAAAWGANIARLASVKDRYDPGNRFRLNANIAPAAGLPGQRPAADATVVDVTERAAQPQ
jgi:FAD/FMN-containing dehydrogenase